MQRGKNKTVYSFKIDKWYITKKSKVEAYFIREKAQAYRDSIGYRLPLGAELTNAYPKYWGKGTNFSPNYYYRKAGVVYLLSGVI
jgi:hypothetical protein